MAPRGGVTKLRPQHLDLIETPEGDAVWQRAGAKDLHAGPFAFLPQRAPRRDVCWLLCAQRRGTHDLRRSADAAGRTVAERLPAARRASRSPERGRA